MQTHRLTKYFFNKIGRPVCIDVRPHPLKKCTEIVRLVCESKDGGIRHVLEVFFDSSKMTQKHVRLALEEAWRRRKTDFWGAEIRYYEDKGGTAP